MTDEDWRTVPSGGARTIAGICEHIGECKFMYANQSFDDGEMSWEDFFPRQQLPDKSSMIEC